MNRKAALLVVAGVTVLVLIASVSTSGHLAQWQQQYEESPPSSFKIFTPSDVMIVAATAAFFTIVYGAAKLLAHKK